MSTRQLSYIALFFAAVVTLVVMASSPTGTQRLPGALSRASLIAHNNTFISRSCAQSNCTWTNQYASFDLSQTENNYHPVYNWADYEGKKQLLEIDIPKRLRSAAVEAYGITPVQRTVYFAEHQPVLDAGWKQILDAIQNREGPVHLENYNVLPAELKPRLFEWVDHTETSFLKAQGFNRDRTGRLTPDYSGIVRANKDYMKPIAYALVVRAIEDKISWLGLRNRFMSLVHSTNYQIPPIIDEGRYIAGLWPPLDAFCRGLADCDTKAVLFCSVLSHFQENKCAIVVIPGHAFNGMYGRHKRMPTDTVIQHRGVDMLLLDITGTSNFPLWGQIHEEDKQNLRESIPEIYETW